MAHLSILIIIYPSGPIYQCGGGVNVCPPTFIKVPHLNLPGWRGCDIYNFPQYKNNIQGQYCILCQKTQQKNNFGLMRLLPWP